MSTLKLTSDKSGAKGKGKGSSEPAPEEDEEWSVATSEMSDLDSPSSTVEWQCQVCGEEQRTSVDEEWCRRCGRERGRCVAPRCACSARFAHVRDMAAGSWRH